MKRIISVFLAIIFIFTLVACGNKKDAVSNIDTFEKPENYATVLLITINPQFRLYLDDQDNVLSVEPINEDAETIVKDTEFKGKLENVIEKIVNKTNDAGFVKENATFDLQIVETKKEFAKAENILNSAKDTANQAFEKIDVTVEIKTAISENLLNNSNTESSSTPVDSSEPDKKNDTSSTESKPAHTHSFANATCTSPKTCSCGATEGTALGHNFKNGKCTVCSAADPNYTALTPLNNKNGKWTGVYVSNGTYYSVRFNLTGEISIGYSIGDPISKMEQEVQDDIRKNKDQPGHKESYIVYQDNEYWCARGSGEPLAPIVENGNTVILTSTEDSGAQIVLTRTDENILTVKSITQAFKDMVQDIPVGAKFTFKSN